MGRPSQRIRANVTVDAALLAEAKALGVSLSATLDAALREKLRAARREAFQRENADAYADARRRVEEDGLLLGAYRRWRGSATSAR
jgi:antitoxin CcdA